MLSAAFSDLVSLGGMSVAGILITVVTAAVIQSSTGVGFGLLLSPVLVFIHPALVPGTVLTLGLLVTGLAAIRELKNLNRTLLIAALMGRVPGAIIASAIIALLSPALFEIIFGLMILSGVLFSVMGPQARPSVTTVGIAGLISGFMGTLTSVGAPPMAIAMQRAPGPEMRATLSAFLLFGSLISIVSLSMFGVFGPGDLIGAVILMPFAFLGFTLSRRIIFHPLMERYLRPSVLVLCVCMALMLIVKPLLAINS